jgi:hypothetical protein
MKVRADTNEMETKRTMSRINKAEMVLWKDKEDQWTLSQTNQKKGRESPSQ